MIDAVNGKQHQQAPTKVTILIQCDLKTGKLILNSSVQNQKLTIGIMADAIKAVLESPGQTLAFATPPVPPKES